MAQTTSDNMTMRAQLDRDNYDKSKMVKLVLWATTHHNNDTLIKSMDVIVGRCPR